jgi:hypothetical protein
MTQVDQGLTKVNVFDSVDEVIMECHKNLRRFEGERFLPNSPTTVASHHPPVLPDANHPRLAQTLRQSSPLSAFSTPWSSFPRPACEEDESIL